MNPLFVAVVLLLAAVNASATTITLNEVATPLTPSQGQVSFSGSVMSSSGSVPNGAPVLLQYSVSPDGPWTTAQTYPMSVNTYGGGYSGSFMAPPAAGTYYFRAYLAGFTTGGVTYQASVSSLKTIIVSGEVPPVTHDFWSDLVSWLNSGMVFGIPNWLIIIAAFVAMVVFRK